MLCHHLCSHLCNAYCRAALEPENAHSHLLSRTCMGPELCCVITYAFIRAMHTAGLLRSLRTHTATCWHTNL
jgi:hypothetical protein